MRVTTRGARAPTAQPRFPPENRCSGPSRARRGTTRKIRHPSGRRRRARAVAAAARDALGLLAVVILLVLEAAMAPDDSARAGASPRCRRHAAAAATAGLLFCAAPDHCGGPRATRTRPGATAAGSRLNPRGSSSRSSTGSWARCSRTSSAASRSPPPTTRRSSSSPAARRAPPPGLAQRLLSYWEAAESRGWFGAAHVRPRAQLEAQARDSLENLLFSLCRYHELVSAYRGSASPSSRSASSGGGSRSPTAALCGRRARRSPSSASTRPTSRPMCPPPSAPTRTRSSRPTRTAAATRASAASAPIATRSGDRYRIRTAAPRARRSSRAAPTAGSTTDRCRGRRRSRRATT